MKTTSIQEFAFAAALSSRLRTAKSPVQARSTASVDAIQEATIQVLLQVGKERLATTKVALRAGKEFDLLQQEMIFLARAYLKACTMRF